MSAYEPWETDVAALRARVTTLEGEVRSLRAMLLPSRDQPPAPAFPQVVPAGCVCPVGAELGCGSSGCPRRRWNFAT